MTKSAEAVAGVGAALALATCATPAARATLVFEQPQDRTVVAAEDDGSQPRVLGRYAFDPVVSADGALVAYRAGPLGTYAKDSWVIRADGSLPPTRVAEGAAPVALSPDGRVLIAIRIDPRTGTEGRTIAQLVSGGPQVVLAARPSAVLDVDVDTATLLVPGRTLRSSGRVVEVPLAGGKARTLATGVDNGATRSRTGRIAYGVEPTQYRMAGLRVTRPGSRVGTDITTRPVSSDLRRPFAWTRDDRRLLVAETQEGEFDVAVVLIDVASGRRRTLARRVDAVGGLSPDGRAVLVERSADAAVPRVLAVPLNGSRPRLLARPARNARWSAPRP